MANLSKERITRIVDNAIENIVGEIERAVEQGEGGRLLSELEWDTLSSELDEIVGSELEGFLKSYELPASEPEEQ